MGSFQLENLDCGLGRIQDACGPGAKIRPFEPCILLVLYIAHWPVARTPEPPIPKLPSGKIVLAARC
jgi:hypothetical protein